MSIDAEAEGDSVKPFSAENDGACNCSEMENPRTITEAFSKSVQELHLFKDMFFENHPLEKAKEKHEIILMKRDSLAVEFEAIDESSIPSEERAQFLYLKGRCYNIIPTYDHRALECLSKAVKLDPSLVHAWNELGECYWKNFNLKEAKACFEGALNQKRDPITLRSLSVLLRQDNCANRDDTTKNILQSVDFAKEAVALDPKDGQSWSILGNAYLCQFFLIAQKPQTLKLALGAYKQAWLDPIARGHPDLHYNKGMALKYSECYDEAIESFKTAIQLDPPWKPPKHELKELVGYLGYIDHLLKNKGKIKAKRIMQMVKSMDQSMLGDYQPGAVVTINKRKVILQHVKLSEMADGDNVGKVVLGRVVGSLHSTNSVPFTFAIVDESMCCIAVNVYNWADGRGAIIGDCVAIPEPAVTSHRNTTTYPEEITTEVVDSKTKDNKSKTVDLVYDFRTIRVNDPTKLRINGKRVGVNEFASTRVTSTYEAH